VSMYRTAHGRLSPHFLRRAFMSQRPNRLAVIFVGPVTGGDLSLIVKPPLSIVTRADYGYRVACQIAIYFSSGPATVEALAISDGRCRIVFGRTEVFDPAISSARAAACSPIPSLS
jgi:hypothetical protein